MKLYYSHQYRNADPLKQAANLARAEQRFLMFRDVYEAKGIELVAPWIQWAKDGMDESLAWTRIPTAIKNSDGVLLDFDGGALSAGMRIEVDLADIHDKPITCAPEPRDGNEWNTRRNKLAAKKRREKRAEYVPPRRAS